MNTEQIAAVEQCAARSLAHEIDFAKVLRTLAKAGVERYHADYCRGELTYYWPTGQSHVVAASHAAAPLGDPFVAHDVEASVRQSQRGEHTYADFVRKTMAAGCVGYFVQITGRRVSYFGRRGECHEEIIPAVVFE